MNLRLICGVYVEKKMTYVIIILTVAIIISEIMSAVKLKKAYKNNKIEGRLKKLYKWRWLLGAPLAIGSFFTFYTVQGDTEKYRIIGLPIMAAAFDEAGRDYVSPLTGPIMFGNAIFWYFIPWLFLFVYLIYKGK